MYVAETGQASASRGEEVDAFEQYLDAKQPEQVALVSHHMVTRSVLSAHTQWARVLISKYKI
jgi:hypothetical protein